jgi:hypothetical protein
MNFKQNFRCVIHLMPQLGYIRLYEVDLTEEDQ